MKELQALIEVKEEEKEEAKRLLLINKLKLKNIIKNNLLTLVGEGNVKAIQILSDILDSEEEKEENRMINPVFNITVSNQQDVEKLKALLIN